MLGAFMARSARERGTTSTSRIAALSSESPRPALSTSRVARAWQTCARADAFEVLTRRGRLGEPISLSVDRGGLAAARRLDRGRALAGRPHSLHGRTTGRPKGALALGDTTGRKGGRRQTPRVGSLAEVDAYVGGRGAMRAVRAAFMHGRRSGGVNRVGRGGDHRTGRAARSSSTTHRAIERERALTARRGRRVALRSSNTRAPFLRLSTLMASVGGAPILDGAQARVPRAHPHVTVRTRSGVEPAPSEQPVDDRRRLTGRSAARPARGGSRRTLRAIAPATGARRFAQRARASATSRRAKDRAQRPVIAACDVVPGDRDTTAETPDEVLAATPPPSLGGEKIFAEEVGTR